MRPDIPLPGPLSRTPDLPPDTAFRGVFSVSAKLRPWSRSCAPRPSGPPRPPSFGPSLTHICLPVPSVGCVSSAAPSRHSQKPGASQSPCSTTAPARGSRALPLTGLVSLPPPLVLVSAHSQATTDSLRNLYRVPGLLCCDPAGGFW